jgi:hypothetical protein
MAAGYAESTAATKVGMMLNRPLVRSELTLAMERAGCTLDKVVKPIVDALKANKTSNFRGRLEETDIPDHTIRFAAHVRAVTLLGGVPKVGESTPSAHGLNLFINIASGAAPRGPELRPVNPAPAQETEGAQEIRTV